MVDVRDLDGLTSLADDAVTELGHIDIVVANAGILNWANAWEMTSEQWNDVIDINLSGVFHTIRATVPHMIEQGTGGSIILTSSAAGLKGQPFTLAYTAAKHGVVGICRGLANELGAYDIRVNSIHPAGVSTEMMNVDGLFQLITQARAHPRPAVHEHAPPPLHGSRGHRRGRRLAGQRRGEVPHQRPDSYRLRQHRPLSSPTPHPKGTRHDDD